MKRPEVSWERVIRLLKEQLGRAIIPALLAISTLGLLGYHLLGLVPFSFAEQATQLGSANLSSIKNDILFAAIKGLQLFILKFSDSDIYIRLASVCVVFIAAALLYLMLRKWYAKRVTVITIIMFITSSWFLHQGRLANLEVLYLTTVPALLLATMWFISKNTVKRLPVVAFLAALTLYTPGAWAFIVFILIVLRKIIAKTAAQLSNKSRVIGCSVFLLTLLPLIYSFALKPGQFIRWIGFDPNQQFTLQAIGTHFIDIPRQLFISGPNNPLQWLVGTPILDVVTLTFFILGLYAYRSGYYASREKLVFGSIIIALILIGAGNVATLSLLIPLIYIVVGNGIAYMLQSWFTVFPRNPVARPIGVILLLIVIASSSFYQLQRYFVAWPNAESTSQTLNRGR